MLHSGRDERWLAYALAMLAGYIDAAGFLMAGGFFVSFMSGNTTRLAAGVAQGSTGWWMAGALIAAFFGGVVAGSLTGRIFAARHSAVLMLVTILLLAAAMAQALILPLWAALLLAFAMGAENAFFERDGEVRIALTYMTGTLVKAGQRMAAALSGEPAQGWQAYLLLWLALSTGAMGGAAMFHLLPQWALWAPVAAMAPMLVATAHFDRKMLARRNDDGPAAGGF